MAGSRACRLDCRAGHDRQNRHGGLDSPRVLRCVRRRPLACELANCIGPVVRSRRRRTSKYSTAHPDDRGEGQLDGSVDDRRPAARWLTRLGSQQSTYLRYSMKVRPRHWRPAVTDDNGDPVPGQASSAGLPEIPSASEQRGEVILAMQPDGLLLGGDPVAECVQ